ncbi:hypothetical protein ACFX14_036068 [Malus domestica]
MIGCGKGGSSPAVALLFSSSLSSSCSSMFWLGLDVLGSSPTSMPLSKVIASAMSTVESKSSLCYCICPMNSVISPICSSLGLDFVILASKKLVHQEFGHNLLTNLNSVGIVAVVAA